MHNTTTAINGQSGRHIAAALAAMSGAVLIAAYSRLCSADANVAVFASPEQAASALYVAVRNDDQDALTKMLGSGKDVVASDDPSQDHVDRERFVEKYREMHRLSREPDGSEVLYVGAENWPFPFPLVGVNGAWRFDSDGGAEQLLLRRIGEDELVAIATCRDLVAQMRSPAGPATASSDQRKLSSAANVDDHAGVLSHGYYFRVLGAQQAGSDASDTPPALVVIAYPAQYRLSGVMTFAVDRDGKIYEADLGAPTVAYAKQLTGLDSTLTWNAIE